MYWPFTFFAYLGLMPNHTGYESVHSLWPANGLWWRQASKAAILILLLINCQSIAKLALLLRFVLCWAAVFLLFIVTPLISSQLGYKKKREIQYLKADVRGGVEKRGKWRQRKWAANTMSCWWSQEPKAKRTKQPPESRFGTWAAVDNEPEFNAFFSGNSQTQSDLIFLLSVNFLQHHSASDLLVCHKVICCNSKIIRC